MGEERRENGEALERKSKVKVDEQNKNRNKKADRETRNDWKRRMRIEQCPEMKEM